MTETITPTWEAKQTDETRSVVEVLNRAGFERADAYRYNSASIRVRVIDERFEGLSVEKRHDMVEPPPETLPDRTQGDIMSLYTFAPSELLQSHKTFRQYALSYEFEDPSPSML